MRALCRTGVFALAAITQAVSAQPGGPATPGSWENASFGAEGPGVGGSLISAVAAAPDGDVFASGNFSSIGGALANRIARWDGSQWHALGAGLEFYASDLATGSDGAVYAAGVDAVGVPGYGVVRWDGQAWTALGDLDGTSGDQVEAVAVGADGTVYASVNTYVSYDDNGYYVGRVIQWTGTEWVPTAPFSPAIPYESTLSDLVVATDGGLYAARQDAVFRWSGSAWVSIGGGHARVLAAGGGGSVYAGGVLDADGQLAAGVARWDGSAWSRLGDASDVYAVEALVAGSDGTVYAGGTFQTFGGTEVNHVARWDGTAWRAMQGGVGKAATGNFNTVVRALALSPDGMLHVGGRFDTAGEHFSPNLARWRDGAWQSSGGGIAGPVRTLARAADGRPVIGGGFRTAGEQVVNSTAIRQGDSWAALGTGPYESTYATISAVERDRDGDLIACGQGTYRWDGTAWNTLDAEPVNCQDLVADAEQTVYAAGSFFAGGTVVQTVRRWDGDAWASLGSPGPFTTTVAVTPGGTLYAGGRFGVARYDGGTWVEIGPVGGNLPVVYTLAAGPDGSLYAGGQFETVGGVSARNVARWDGASWRALGAGTDQTVRALLVDPARGLYAGGDFEEAGGVDAPRIALWDGDAWAPLGSGTDGPVYALLADGPDGLLAGGFFARAGDSVSPYVARWNARPVAADAPPDEPVALHLDVSPSPARGTATARVQHPAGPVTVDLFDARGRHVATALAGDGPAGQQAVPLRLGGLAPGVYVVRLAAGGRVQTRPLVVVR